MAIKIGTNLAYNGKLPNFERDTFDTKAAMKAFDENSIDEGHLSYCKEDGNIYQYKSANSTDATTGRWRIFKTDIVVDVALNGTSKNPIQNKAVFDALKLKADAAVLDKYQPKYAADYIATEDISTLPITNGVIDLNGNQIDLPNIDLVDGYLTIMNGTVVFNSTTTNLRVTELELSNVTISYSDDVNMVLDIQKLKCINVVDYPGLRINFTEGSAIEQATLINSSIRTASLSVTETLNMYNSTCNINGNVKLTAYNSFVCDDGLSLANGSAWYNTQLDISPYYTSGWIDEAGKIHCGMYFDDTITGDSDYAPQTKAVYNAFQLKADKTQLNDLATKTDFVDLRNKVNAMPKTVFITQAAYNALTTKDANTIYYING